MVEGLNKKALTEALAEKFDLTKKAAGEIVDLIFDEITASLKNGNPVDIAGFGKFIIKERGSRQGINPRTKEKITIAAARIPGFKPAKALKDVFK